MNASPGRSSRRVAPSGTVLLFLVQITAHVFAFCFLTEGVFVKRRVCSISATEEQQKISHVWCHPEERSLRLPTVITLRRRLAS